MSLPAMIKCNTICFTKSVLNFACDSSDELFMSMASGRTRLVHILIKQLRRNMPTLEDESVLKSQAAWINSASKSRRSGSFGSSRHFLTRRSALQRAPISRTTSGRIAPFT